MSSGVAIKQESALEDYIYRKEFFFDNATAQYFVSAESKQIGINIDCSWNQPLRQNIRIVDRDKIYSPTETQILIYKNIDKEINTHFGILLFYEGMNVGDPICDSPESLSAQLFAGSEVFEGICDIIFKYKQQVGIKIEAKNIKEDIWDVTKEKRLVVTGFSVFSKKTNGKDPNVALKAENNYEGNQEHHLTEFSQQSLEKVFKYLKKLF